MAEEKTTVERTQKSVTDEEKKQKVRNFAVVVYPDSTTLIKNWRENLQALGHKAIISPVHDKDIDKNGLPKKPHYHVCVFRENATSPPRIIKTITIRTIIMFLFIKITNDIILYKAIKKHI